VAAAAGGAANGGGAEGSPCVGASTGLAASDKLPFPVSEVKKEKVYIVFQENVRNFLLNETVSHFITALLLSK